MFEPGSLSRNSHIPACTECRIRKAKCSKSRPSCVQCSRQNKVCVYPTKTVRTPLTRQHLTDVETRLHMLETAIDKLFPNGEMEAIMHSLLMDELPRPAPDLNDQEPLRGSSLFLGNSEQSASFDELGTLQMNIDTSPKISAVDESPPSETRPAESLASVEDEEEFLDGYFCAYHPIYPFVHEASFRASFNSQIPIADQKSWLALRNVVLAVGARTLSYNTEDIMQKYYTLAKHHLQQVPIFDKGNLTLVQALLLFSDVAQRLGKPEEGWIYLGTAVRMAIGLNLHREPSDSDQSMTPLDKEIRRRVWWTVYCFDSCFAKIYGRPLLLPEEVLITAKPVSNIDDAIFSGTPLSATVDNPTIYSGLIQQSSYHYMANRIYRRLLASPHISAHTIAELEKTIDNWHTDSGVCTQQISMNPVPDWYLISRNRQMLCDRSLRLLIYRPLLLQWFARCRINSSSEEGNQDGELQCRAQALNIAHTTIEIICDYVMGGKLSGMTLSFTLYSLFHALVVPVIHLKANPSSPESISWAQDVEKVKSIIPYLSVKNDALSVSFLLVLNGLCSTASETSEEYAEESQPGVKGKNVKPRDVQLPSNNIFGNEELALLESGTLKMQLDVDFSEWIDPDAAAHG